MKKIISIILCICILASAAALFSGCKKDGKDADGPMAYILGEKGNTYSLGLAEEFKDEFEGLGGSVTMETFPTGTHNFSEFFSKAIDVNAEVIFLPNSIANAPDLLKNAKEMGISVPILAGDTWESPVVLEAVKDTGLEVYVTAFFDEGDTSEKAAEFVSGFKKYVIDYYDMNGGTDKVSSVCALGFDAYNVTLDAISRAADKKGSALTSNDVAEELWATDCQGVTGKITFDKNGDAIKDRAYIKKAAADGTAFEFVKAQTVENNAKKAQSPGYAKGGVTIDTDNKRITVGVYEATTGDDCAGGKQELLGIMYAHELRKTVTIDGEEYEIHLCISDNGSLKEYSLAAATKIVDEGSIAVIGSYGSGVSIAAAPVFEKACIPAVGASCTNAEVTAGNSYYFRTTILDAAQCEAMADFAFTLIDTDKAE